MTDDVWEIVSFSPAEASGRIRERASGREVSFAIEAWVPCDPATARLFDDSDERRHLLAPRPGEAVEVSFRTSSRGDVVPAKVVRRAPMEAAPLLSFADWLARMAEHVPELSGWQALAWGELAELSGDLVDAMRSEAPALPEAHLGLLAWLITQPLSEPTATGLRWLTHRAPAEGAQVAALGAEGPLFVALARPVVARLVTAGLLIEAPRAREAER